MGGAKKVILQVQSSPPPVKGIFQVARSCLRFLSLGPSRPEARTGMIARMKAGPWEPWFLPKAREFGDHGESGIHMLRRVASFCRDEDVVFSPLVQKGI